MKNTLLIPAVVGLVSFSSLASAVVYDAAADFSTGSNPNGVWSYGYESSSTFTLFNTVGNTAGLIDYQKDAGIDSLGVYKNIAGSTTNYGTVSLDAYELVQHPGNSAERSIVRFTAQTAGTYSVSVAYKGVDWVGPTSSDASLNVNGVSQFAGNVNGFGATSLIGYTSTFVLAAGDTIDSSVGFGGNGNYYYDSTGVSFRVESVPEPMTMAALGLGAATLLRRRRKA